MTRTLDELVEAGEAAANSLIVRMHRTKSDGNYGNWKWEASLSVEVSDDADYNEVLAATTERVRRELEDQEAVTEMVDGSASWLRGIRTPEALQEKRLEIEASTLLTDERKARLLERVDAKLVAAEAEAERRAEEKEARERRKVTIAEWNRSVLGELVAAAGQASETTPPVVEAPSPEPATTVEAADADDDEEDDEDDYDEDDYEDETEQGEFPGWTPAMKAVPLDSLKDMHAWNIRYLTPSAIVGLGVEGLLNKYSHQTW